MASIVSAAVLEVVAREKKLLAEVCQRVASDLIRPFDRGDDTETPAPAAASLVLYRGDSTFSYPVERFRGADRASVVVAGRCGVDGGGGSMW